MRVATFNIRNGRAWDGRHCWPLRRRATVAAIEALDADVIALQEAFGFQLRWLARQLPAFEVHGDVGRDDGRRGERCPILVRRGGPRIIECSTHWYGDTPDCPGTRMPGARFPRLATICHLIEPVSGQPVLVTNTHLDSAVAVNRLRSVEQLLGWLDPELPWLVLGDLNTRPDTPPLRRLGHAGLRQALPSDAGGTNHNFTGRLDGARIDHVLVSGHWEVVSAEVVTGVGAEERGCLLASDHWPVRAELRLPRPNVEGGAGEGGEGLGRG